MPRHSGCPFLTIQIQKAKWRPISPIKREKRGLEEAGMEGEGWTGVQTRKQRRGPAPERMKEKDADADADAK